MNAQDYISSGLLEAYVLGGLSLSESEQVAGAMCRFPEVAAAVRAMETDMLRAAEDDAIALPDGLGDQIWAAIQQQSTAKPIPETNSPELPVAEKHHTKVIPFEGSRRHKTGFDWARAAMWLLIAGAGISAYTFWQGRKEAEQQLAVAQQQLQEAGNKTQLLASTLDRYKKEAEMMAEPGVTPVPMLSMQAGHPMAATMYWNRAKGEAYVSVQKLPPPPAGMQYQLWAIADGKPVDLGMVDNEVVLNGGMQKVSKAVTSSQAFAVSLEKEGGNPTPTADRIYLMGKMLVS